MPTYEYRCRTCQSGFEIVQSFSDDALTTCPSADHPASPTGCVSPGEGEVRKVFSAPGITFKGDGFYKTDSRPKSSGGSKSSSSESSSSDSKSDSKSSSSSDSKSTSSDSSSSSSKADSKS